MKLSDLVQVCADHGLDEKPTLAVYARFLREAGRIPTEGRRTKAADMSPLHAARFITACMATDNPSEAVRVEQVFSELQNSLDDRLAEYLAVLLEQTKRRYRIVVQRNRLAVTVRFDNEEVIFHSRQNSYKAGKDVSAYLRHDLFFAITNQMKQEK